MREIFVTDQLYAVFSFLEKNPISVDVLKLSDFSQHKYRLASAIIRSIITYLWSDCFKTIIMINQIKTFKGNALALELVDTFTETDANLIIQLFEEKLKEGHKHINMLIKVKDLSVLHHMEMKGFFKGELWGIKHFNYIGRCAVVAHSHIIESVVKIENKALHLFNPALEEKYFDAAQLDEALKFVNPDE